MSERWETIERLKAIDFTDGEDSNARLTAICNAIFVPECGWTVSACDVLRAMLIKVIANAGFEEWSDARLEEAGLIRLPMDSDGVEIRFGDYCIDDEEQGIPIHVVKSLQCTTHGEHVTWMWIDEHGDSHDVDASHHCLPTVEDVLRELVDDVVRKSCLKTEGEAIYKRYADRIREVI